jgi:transmembrane sensor
MSQTDERIADAIIEQALEWHMRHREGDLSPAMRTAFMQWLRQSPLNVREYLEIARMAGHLPQALASVPADVAGRAEIDAANVVFLHEEHAAPPPGLLRDERDLAKSPARPWRWVALAAALCALAVGAGLHFGAVGYLGVIGVLPINAPADEQLTVTLNDGSRIHMNSKARVHVRFSNGERLIMLQQGQVLFDVAQDWTRPFRVRAGAADIVAVGTRFDVNRRESGLTVTVVEGKVDVVDRLPADVASGAAQPAMFDQPLRLTAGEQVEVGPDVRLAKAQPADVRAATAWMHREIVFTEKSLADVTEELNQYLEKPIVIEDAALRSLRVSGIFNAYDMESFLAFLKQYDVDIDAREDVVYVRARPRASLPRPVVAGK